MIAYVDAHKERFGVEPICEQLPIAPSTYYAAKSRPPSARAVRDEGLKTRDPACASRQLRRRLRGAQGLVAAWPRGNPGRSLHGREAHEGPGAKWRQKRCLQGHNDSQTSTCPALRTWWSATSAPAVRTSSWVADITFVATWSGFVYVAFVTDVFSRKIVGWRVSRSLSNT